ncbi:efflux RND transporter periplasmic adaptor subunit [Candidatus Kapabacteria bacterium]|nr:efflux RND transporter periplasmic adaptor subunit [Candidatus Kapabacteria bacterium]
MKKILLISLLVLALSSCQEKQLPEVEVTKVERKTITQRVKAVGKIQPETQVKIASEISGELVYIGAKEGDFITVGKTLARIKPDIIETQLEGQKAATEAAKMDIDFNKAQLKQAEQNYKRIKGLYEKEYASKQEFEQAKAAYDQNSASLQSSIARFAQSEASLKQLKRNADRTTIQSPISGVLTSLSVEIGEKILGTIQTQGTEIMRVSDLNIINSMVEVDENDIVLIELGDSVNIEIDAFPDSTFKGYVIEIGHSAITSNMGSQDEVTNFEVKIRMINSNKKIRPGMSCNVEIETESRENVLAVPLQSVTVRKKAYNSSNSKRGGMVDKSKEKEEPSPIVFTFENDKAIQNNVKIGISDRGFIEVIDGLSEGDEIISGPYSAVSKELNDSISVKVTGDNAGAKNRKNK